MSNLKPCDRVYLVKNPDRTGFVERISGEHVYVCWLYDGLEPHPYTFDELVRYEG